MNAYKVEAVVAENGTVTLRGLPFQVGVPSRLLF